MTPSDSAGPKIGGVGANSLQFSFKGAELSPILPVATGVDQG